MQSQFRYCFNTSTVQGQKLTLVEEIELAAAAGYDAIEPWIGELDIYVANGGSLPDLKRLIEDHGLTVEGAIGFFEWIVDDDKARAAGLAEARRNMEMLAQIDGKHIAAPPWGAHEQSGIDLFKAAERYRALLEIGDETGVVPMVEVWGFSKSLNRLGEAALIAAESGHSKACILCDVYHLYKGGSPVSALSLLNGAALPVFHVNDYPAIAPSAIQDADRVYPGDGIAPLADIFRTLRAIGFDGYLSLELFNKDYYEQDAVLVARTGLEKLRAVVEGL